MFYHGFGPSLVAQTVKNLPAMQETQVWFLGQEVPLEKEMATHSSILAYRIPWTEEPGKLKSTRLHRFGLLSNQKNLALVLRGSRQRLRHPSTWSSENWSIGKKKSEVARAALGGLTVRMLLERWNPWTWWKKRMYSTNGRGCLSVSIPASDLKVWCMIRLPPSVFWDLKISHNTLLHESFPSPWICFQFISLGITVAGLMSWAFG